MMQSVLGKWQIDRSKDSGVKEFMIATGVPPDLRQTLLEVDPVFEWEVNGTTITYSAHFQDQDSVVHLFQMGKQFDMEKLEGLKFQCTVTLEGGKWVESYIDIHGKPFVTTRLVDGDRMYLTTTAEGASMTQELHRC